MLKSVGPDILLLKGYSTGRKNIPTRNKDIDVCSSLKGNHT